MVSATLRDVGDASLDELYHHVKTMAVTGWAKVATTAQTGWSRMTRRVRIASGGVLFCILSIVLIRHTMPEDLSIPKISFEFSGSEKPTYNVSKVALLVENRPSQVLAPIMLHFMSVVPPDWRFHFMGTEESVELVNSSRAIRDQVTAGKLDLTYLPPGTNMRNWEEISRFFTTLSLYETVLQPAEWLLVFQTDSILCANSRLSLNSFLEYDWVGAPWNTEGEYGGNGGLSLRRVSKIIEVLRSEPRMHNSDPEDVWFSERLHLLGANLANGSISTTFSAEQNSGKKVEFDDKKVKIGGKKGAKGDLIHGIDDWRDGFYEPMGYHTGGSGKFLHSAIWGTPEMRKHLWDYCPELKMTVKMDAAKYVPGECNTNWKRSMDGLGVSTEIIDGVEYPLLPPGIVPW